MSDSQDGLPTPRRYFAIIAILSSIVMTVLDQAMLGVALPGIAHDLQVSPASATWLLNAYQLTIVTTLLPLASLGEVRGFRGVFLAGFCLFAAGSLGCFLAPDFHSLLACRMVQGLGSSAVMSLTGGLIRYTYPTSQLGRAIGINAMTVAGFSAAAPSIAAGMLAFAPWPFLFLLTLPVGLAGLAIGAWALPRPAGTGRRFDGAGAALNILAFGLFFVGLDLLLARPLAALGLMAAGLAALGAQVRRQRRQPSPLLPLDLLRIPVVAFAVAGSVAGFAAWYASYVALPFLLQSEGRSQVATGLLMTPWPLALAFVAPIAGRLSDSIPSALLGAAGMVVMALGLLALSLLPPGAAGWLIALAVAFCGAGFGGFQTPNNRTMLSAAPKARSGGAGGMQATARLLGNTLGTTVVALAFQLAGPAGPRFAVAMGILFALVSAGCCLARRGLR